MDICVESCPLVGDPPGQNSRLVGTKLSPRAANSFRCFARKFPQIQLAIILAVAAVAVLVPAVAAGQDREACPDCGVDAPPGERGGFIGQLPGGVEDMLFATPDSWTLRKRVDEVTVFFTATDGRKFVQGLEKDNIHVLDDHKPVARISAFGYQRDLPLRLGLMVDTSSSVNPRFRFEQKSAIQFLHQILRRGLDRAFVLGFASHVECDPGLQRRS